MEKYGFKSVLPLYSADSINKCCLITNNPSFFLQNIGFGFNYDPESIINILEKIKRTEIDEEIGCYTIYLSVIAFIRDFYVNDTIDDIEIIIIVICKLLSESNVLYSSISIELLINSLISHFSVSIYNKVKFPFFDSFFLGPIKDHNVFSVVPLILEKLLEFDGLYSDSLSFEFLSIVQIIIAESPSILKSETIIKVFYCIEPYLLKFNHISLSFFCHIIRFIPKEFLTELYEKSSTNLIRIIISRPPMLIKNYNQNPIKFIFDEFDSKLIMQEVYEGSLGFDFNHIEVPTMPDDKYLVPEDLIMSCELLSKVIKNTQEVSKLFLCSFYESMKDYISTKWIGDINSMFIYFLKRLFLVSRYFPQMSIYPELTTDVFNIHEFSMNYYLLYIAQYFPDIFEELLLKYSQYPILFIEMCKILTLLMHDLKTVYTQIPSFVKLLTRFGLQYINQTEDQDKLLVNNCINEYFSMLKCFLLEPTLSRFFYSDHSFNTFFFNLLYNNNFCNFSKFIIQYSFSSLLTPSFIAVMSQMLLNIEQRIENPKDQQILIELITSLTLTNYFREISPFFQIFLRIIEKMSQFDDDSHSLFISLLSFFNHIERKDSFGDNFYPTIEKYVRRNKKSIYVRLSLLSFLAGKPIVGNELFIVSNPMMILLLYSQYKDQDYYDINNYIHTLCTFSHQNCIKFHQVQLDVQMCNDYVRSPCPKVLIESIVLIASFSSSISFVHSFIELFANNDIYIHIDLFQTAFDSLSLLLRSKTPDLYLPLNMNVCGTFNNDQNFLDKFFFSIWLYLEDYEMSHILSIYQKDEIFLSICLNPSTIHINFSEHPVVFSQRQWFNLSLEYNNGIRVLIDDNEVYKAQITLYEHYIGQFCFKVGGSQDSSSLFGYYSFKNRDNNIVFSMEKEILSKMEKSILNSTCFSAVFRQYFHTESLYPLIKYYIDNKLPCELLGKQIGIIELISYCLEVYHHERDHFVKDGGNRILKHLIISNKQFLIYEHYVTLFCLYKKSQDTEFKEVLFDQILVDFSIWSQSCLITQKQIVSFLLGIFYENISFFRSFLPFSKLLVILEVYYTYGKHFNEMISECRKVILEIGFLEIQDSMSVKDFQSLISHCLIACDNYQRYDLVCFLKKIIINRVFDDNTIISQFNIISGIQRLLNFNDEVLTIEIFNIVHELHSSYGPFPIDCSFHYMLLSHSLIAGQSIVAYHRSFINCLNNGCYDMFPLCAFFSYQLLDSSLYSIQPIQAFSSIPFWSFWPILQVFKDDNNQEVIVRFLFECGIGKWKEILLSYYFVSTLYPRELHRVFNCILGQLFVVYSISNKESSLIDEFIFFVKQICFFVPSNLEYSNIGIHIPRNPFSNNHQIDRLGDSLIQLRSWYDFLQAILSKSPESVFWPFLITVAVYDGSISGFDCLFEVTRIILYGNKHEHLDLAEAIMFIFNRVGKVIPDEFKSLFSVIKEISIPSSNVLEFFLNPLTIDNSFVDAYYSMRNSCAIYHGQYEQYLSLFLSANLDEDLELEKVSSFISRCQSNNQQCKNLWRKLWFNLSTCGGPWCPKNENTNTVIRLKRDFGLRTYFCPSTMKANSHFNNHENATNYYLNTNYDERDLREELSGFIAEPSDVTIPVIQNGYICDIITLYGRKRGVLRINHESIQIECQHGIKDETILIIDIVYILKRDYLHHARGIEIVLITGKTYFIYFPNDNPSSIIKRIISKKAPNLILAQLNKTDRFFASLGITVEWECGSISNFEYLMKLNLFGGRSFHDLSQYPIFPWVLSDYQSEELDFNNRLIYRDLSKPIGAINEERLADLYSRMNDMNSYGYPPFLYGCYSICPMIVLHWLIRMEPFTSLHIDLQGGHFDNASRLFISINSAWNMATNNINDYRELIPEFFFSHEFLKNSNQFEFGIAGDQKVDDVNLPPWAKTAFDFIYLNRKALESKYVSENLNNWIDLMWGYKQRGIEAEKAHNLFLPDIYDSIWTKENLSNPVERSLIESTKCHVGQVPCQLFHSPHPEKQESKEISNSQSKAIALNSELRKISCASIHENSDVFMSIGNEVYHYVLKFDGVATLSMESSSFYDDEICELYDSIPYLANGKIYGFSDTNHVTCVSKNNESIVAVCEKSYLTLYRHNKKIIIPYYGEEISCVCHSTSFDTIAFGSKSGKLILLSLSKKKVKNNVFLDNYIPESISITPSWGFIFVYAKSPDQVSKLFLLTINGEILKCLDTKQHLTKWYHWTSTSGFDYSVVTNDLGHVFSFESYYPKLDEPIFKAFSPIKDVTYWSKKLCLVMVTGDGKVTILPHMFVQ